MIAVVIPTYKIDLSEIEYFHLTRILHVFKSRAIYFVQPQGLTRSYAKSYSTVFFPDAYFASIQGYNRLLLSARFYDAFKDFTHIVICQLDVLVIKDELENWLAYDYCGSPWIEWADYHSVRSGLPRIKRALLKIYAPKHFVGNGGFSLRRVQTFRRYLRFFQWHANQWENNEDVYWSLVAPVRWYFRVPGYKRALQFGFDCNPERALSLNDGKLPMAIHNASRYSPSFYNTIKVSGT